ncbi:ribosomal L1 domain-containing protein 1 [Nilaparvata lugens]|uniref:ribosomal L1 domain-containing protein 1 n=1 Tax=Nilaparvata lugens TaxID=108931 RepID=UPI00193CFF9D|nr:ribosomal L1 domain-containing protein 1 [Nilaparvata lugens]
MINTGKPIANRQPLKVKSKKNDKHSPEYKLGLRIEKLLEQGVRLKKIEDVLNVSNRGDDKVSEKMPVKKGFARATNKNVCLVKSKSKRHRPRFIMINGIRKRISKLKKAQVESKEPTVTNLNFEIVKKAVEACLKNVEDTQSTDQLLDEGVPLNLFVSSIRKPVMPKRFVRYQLPHSYLDDLADVCLIVPDKKSWNNKLEDPEITINDVQDVLRSNDVTCVKKVITMEQIKTEYARHEIRRKLCNSYDYFLVDNRLLDEIHSNMGTIFQRQKKAPVAIKMQGGNLKEKINKALAKTTMKLSTDQDTFDCRIGHSKQPIEELAENIVAVGQQLDTFFPGSFKNVRFVAVKTARSISFPIYYSTKTVNEVARPIIAAKRPRLYEVATDELSTIGKQVSVHPDGTVTVVGEQSNKKQKAKKTTKSPAKKADAQDKVGDKPAEEEEADEGEEEDGGIDSDEEFNIDSNDEDFDDNVEEEVDSDSNSPFIFEKKKKTAKSAVKNAEDDSDASGTDSDESDTEDEDFSRKTEEAYLQSLGGDEDSDDEEQEEEKKEKEVKEVAKKDKQVKEQKKRKSTENVVTKAPKKFKPSAPANPPTPSKINNKATNQKPNSSRSNKQKSKAVKRKTFDTSLGETLSIKKKCDLPESEKVAPRKRNRNTKLSKSQKKGNMKMKKAKQNKA